MQEVAGSSPAPAPMEEQNFDVEPQFTDAVGFIFEGGHEFVTIQNDVYVDPNHRITALHFLEKLAMHHDFLGDIEFFLHDSPDKELARKQILNEMFEKADYIVNYITNGERIPLVGTIQT